MLRIRYGEKSEFSISDFKAESYVDFILATYDAQKNLYKDFVVEISNEIVLNFFVLRVYQGKIPFEEIKFYFNDEELELDKYCGIEEPKNSSNTFINLKIVNQIIQLGYDRMRKDKGWPKI